ncbi:MAG TPA: hypothetical protein VIU85_01840 [Chthoniobacterales bacterium]
MQPSEALSASMQVAVTLAGFAGVVVAFRSGSVHEWSKVDKFRLRILLVNSGIPFALSILGMLLSATGLTEDRVWQVCSIIGFVTIAMVGQQLGSGMRGFSPEEFRAGGGSLAIFYSSSVIAIAVTLLQLYNAIVLKTFWPFFAGIATQLVLAILQFIRLVLAGDHSGVR